MFINSLLSSTNDPNTKKLIKKEYQELGVNRIVEKLKNDENIDDHLAIQCGVFEDEMEMEDEQQGDDEEVEIDNLDNPNEILKLIRIQLSGTDAFDHFINILQLFLIISGRATPEE